MIQKIGVDLGQDMRNIINTLIDIVNGQSSALQNLVAEGQLTEEQYQKMLTVLNGLIEKGGVTVSDININLGKIGLEHLADEVIQAIAGGAPVNAVVADNGVTTPKLTTSSVSTEKTSFIKIGKNIFRWKNVTQNKAVSETTGQLLDSQYYVVSDYEPVLPSTAYTQNKSEVVVFLDINKKYISGLAKASDTSQPRTFTTPANTYYIQTNALKEGAGAYNYKGYQIEKGTVSTSFEEYYRYIDYLRPLIADKFITLNMLADKSVSLDALAFTESTVNLFDMTKVTQGYYVNPTTGQLSVNASYVASDFINISDATQTTKNNTNNLYAYYDASYNFIPTTTTQTQTFTKPSNAVYERISVLKTEVDKAMLVKGATLPSSYVESKKYIPNRLLESSAGKVESDYGKEFLKAYIADFSKAMNTAYDGRAEIAFLGDSWVAGGVEKQGERLTRPFRERLLKTYADGGIGFVSYANKHIGNGEISITLTGTWTHYDEGLGNIAQSKGLDSAMVESSTAGDSIKVQFYEDLDFYEIHTLSTGTWRYNVDGGEWVMVNATTQDVTPINLFLGKHIINIEIVSGLVTFIGSYAYKGNKGVVVHKIGNSGLRGGHMTSTDRTNYVKQLKRCRANTFGILLGTNEMAQNIPIATYENDLKEIISRIREAKPLASIFLIAPSGNKYDNLQTHTIQEYSDTQLKVAKELNVAHVSLYRYLGDFVTTNANGLMYSDGVHPNKFGGNAIANVVYDRLLRI